MKTQLRGRQSASGLWYLISKIVLAVCLVFLLSEGASAQQVDSPSNTNPNTQTTNCALVAQQGTNPDQTSTTGVLPVCADTNATSAPSMNFDGIQNPSIQCWVVPASDDQQSQNGQSTQTVCVNMQNLFSPNQFSQFQYPPSIYAPSQYSPNQYQPNQYQSNQYQPNQYQPNQYQPNQYQPNQYQPNQYQPNQYQPNQYQPNQYQPNQYQSNQYQSNQYQSNQYQSNQYQSNQYQSNQYQPNQYFPYRPGQPIYPNQQQTGLPNPTEFPAAAPDQPERIQNPIPYRNVPSLRDLYTQVPSSGGALHRFGSDAFLYGTGSANELTSDLPVGSDYVLGAGDRIVVNMWGGRSERLSIEVDKQGEVVLPEAGTVTVNGMTVAQAESAIQHALSTQFQNEHVEISLGRLRTVRVYVVGDVQRPGAYDVSSLSTPLSVLYAAGGPTARGSLRVLKQFRNEKLVKLIDLYDYLLKGLRSNTDRIQAGDTILVPPAGPQVTVEGMVHHPAIYELNGETNLSQVIDLAGDVLVTANLKQIEVSRVDANTKRTMLNLQLPESQEGIKKALSGFLVQRGDDVVISQILPYNQKAVYLEGHVFRPGRYAYTDGMTLGDLLHSYQDIMPEPANHAEIVRLVAPDFHPETIPFDLPNALIGNTPIPLQPFDTVRVYGRYAADAPTVKIDGEVLHPGYYPLSIGMTVTALIEMAGGFSRSALRDSAGLSSYEVQNGHEVLINHTEVDLSKTLNGDQKANPMLKSGDVVSIRQLTNWSDIGSSILVSGELAHPGSYGIESGERLSSVLKRAGGFLPAAYPEAAIFTRVQVQQLAEQARQQMILRVETTPVTVQPGADQQQTQLALEAERTRILTTLRNQPASGRMVVNLTPDIKTWENTSADIVLRAGDRIVIPKLPSFVMITGQVFNPVAINFRPGKDVSWYLKQGGGATHYGDKRNIYVLRANGSVVGHSGFANMGIMSERMRPGDTIVVPERLTVANDVWKDIIAAAQAFSTIALAAAAAGVF